MKSLLTFFALALFSASASAQIIDVEIRNRQILSATQFRYEIWEKAGTGYITDNTAYNMSANPNPAMNGNWTGQQIRFVFTLPAGTTVTSAAISRNNATTSNVNYSVQAMGSQLNVSAGRSDDGSYPDLDGTYVRLYTITLTTTGTALNSSNTNLINLATNATTTFWSNSYDPSTERPMNNVQGAVALPLQLTAFTASKLTEQSAELSWTTAQEKNMDRFEIERSADGRFFSTKIGTVAATNGNTKMSYTLQDRKPLPGDNFYRLKMVENDGKVTYSEVRKLNFDRYSNNSITVLKNPFAESTTIRITAEEAQTAAYVLTDAAGRTILNSKWDVAAGDNTYTVSLGGLASGTYLLSVKGASVSGQVKLLKAE